MRKHCFQNVFVIASLLLVSMGGLGCASSQNTARESGDGSTRNPQLAAKLTHEATSLLTDDPAQALSLLQEALEADLYYGPAHNNLGVIYLSQDMLYEAAEEFDWARRLMPGHPDPRINLGLALERGGKTSEALEAYASAIEVYPDHLPAMQALARLQIRSGNRDEETQLLLREIAYRGGPEWKDWAMTQLRK